MTPFHELGLSDPLLRSISDLGFTKPSDIQLNAIPNLIRKDRDFLGLAQTGTGKTAAFGLPLLDKIDPQVKHIQALILTPTRELCQQVADQLGVFSKYLPKIHILTVYGGASITNQIRDIKRGGQIVVATPGRLVDLNKRKAINLSSIKYLILDEADEMLNMGFKEDLDKILSYTPEDKYTWLFSATMKPEIKKITESYMDNPVEVHVKQKEIVNKDIKHYYMVLRREQKILALERLMDLHVHDMRAIVFCRTKRDTEELSSELSKNGYQVDFINGDLSQGQRDKVMQKFKVGQSSVLIATDVAARGIDVDDLTHVIHYQLPDQDEYYTHRSGRTARGGKKGKSLVFCLKNDVRKISYLERKLKIKFEEVEVPTFDEVRVKKVNKYIDKLLTQELLHEGAHSILEEEVVDMLMVLDKEELIRKLVSRDLGKLLLKTEKKISNKVDRKVRKQKQYDRGNSERPKKKRNKSNKDYVLYSLNVGKGDISNTGHILRIMHQYTGLGKKNYGEIKLEKFQTLVEVEQNWKDHFEAYSKGLRINNKTVRIKKI